MHKITPIISLAYENLLTRWFESGVSPSGSLVSLEPHFQSNVKTRTNLNTSQRVRKNYRGLLLLIRLVKKALPRCHPCKGEWISFDACRQKGNTWPWTKKILQHDLPHDYQWQRSGRPPWIITYSSCAWEKDGLDARLLALQQCDYMNDPLKEIKKEKQSWRHRLFISHTTIISCQNVYTLDDINYRDRELVISIRVHDHFYITWAHFK